jgi:hypothetical protein
MVEKDYFSVQRLSIESKTTLREISQALKQYFAITSWDATSDRLLQEKVRHKIKRVRATLLSQRKIIRGRDGYTVQEDTEEEETGLDTCYTLADAVDTLARSERALFFSRLFETWDNEALSQVTEALTQRLSYRLCQPYPRSLEIDPQSP